MARHYKRLSLTLAALLMTHIMGLATPTSAAPAKQGSGTFDLSVSKSLNLFGNTPIAVGSIVQYSIFIGNPGSPPAPPYTITITERVPANMRFAETNSTPGWSCADGSGPGSVCTRTVNDQSYGFFTFGLTATLPANAAARFVTNTVSIGSNFTDPDRSNNTFTTTHEIDLRRVAIVQTGGLALDANGNSLADPNDEMAYTFTVTNTGLVALPDLGLRAPAYLNQNCGFGELASVDVITPTAATTLGSIEFTNPGFGGFCSSAFKANFGTLGLGQSARVTYRARPSAQRSTMSVFAINQAVVEQQTGQFSYIEALGYSGPITTPLPLLADLALASANMSHQPGTGSTTLGVYYSNSGAGAANGSVITVPYPPYATPDLTTNTYGWTCTSTQCVVNLGDLTPGAGGFASLVLSPTASLPAAVNTLELTATISHSGAPAPEGNPLNNVAAASSLFGTAPAYTATLTYGFAFDQRSDAKIEPGDIVSFTAVLTNSSATRAGNNVRFYINHNGACCDGGTLVALANTIVTNKGSILQNGNPVAINVPTLAPGESVVVQFNASATSLPSQLVGKHVSTAQVGDDYIQNFSGLQTLDTKEIPAFYARSASLRKRVETARPDGYVSFNERVTFTLNVTHTGIEAFPELLVEDYEMSCFEILTPTVTTSFGSVVPGNGFYFGNNGFRVLLPNFAPGQTATIRANAIVSSAFSSCYYNFPYSLQARNTAHLGVPSGNQYSGPERIAQSNTTSNPVRIERMITETQTLMTTHGQPSVAPGERITITILVTNVGTAQLRDVTMFNSSYTCLTLVPGSATTTVGAISELQGTPTALVASIGSLEIDQTAQVRFSAVVSTDAQCTSISNMPTFSALYPQEIGGSNTIAPIGNPISVTRSIAAFQPTPVPTAQPTTPPVSSSRRLLLPIVRR
jgi:hypothetical protein